MLPRSLRGHILASRCNLVLLIVGVQGDCLQHGCPMHSTHVPGVPEVVQHTLQAQRASLAYSQPSKIMKMAFLSWL